MCTLCFLLTPKEGEDSMWGLGWGFMLKKKKRRVTSPRFVFQMFTSRHLPLLDSNDKLKATCFIICGFRTAQTIIFWQFPRKSLEYVFGVRVRVCDFKSFCPSCFSCFLYVTGQLTVRWGDVASLLYIKPRYTGVESITRSFVWSTFTFYFWEPVGDLTRNLFNLQDASLSTV